MYYGFTLPDTIEAALLIVALLLLRSKDHEDLKRLVTIVLYIVLCVGVLYEGGRLYLAPHSVDSLSRVLSVTFVAALIGKLTEETCNHGTDEYVALGVKVLHIALFFTAAFCGFFAIVLRS